VGPATPFTSVLTANSFSWTAKHHPVCGTDLKLEEAMRKQPSVTSITIEFADGTTRKMTFAASEE